MIIPPFEWRPTGTETPGEVTASFSLDYLLALATIPSSAPVAVTCEPRRTFAQEGGGHF